MTYPFSIPDRVLLHLYAHRDDPPETRSAPVVLKALAVMSRRESLTRIMQCIDPDLFIGGEVTVKTRQGIVRVCRYYDLTPEGVAVASRLAHLAEISGMTPEQAVATRFRDSHGHIIQGGERVACTTSQ